MRSKINIRSWCCWVRRENASWRRHVRVINCYVKLTTLPNGSDHGLACWHFSAIALFISNAHFCFIIFSLYCISFHKASMLWSEWIIRYIAESLPKSALCSVILPAANERDERWSSFVYFYKVLLLTQTLWFFLVLIIVLEYCLICLLYASIPFSLSRFLSYF